MLVGVLYALRQEAQPQSSTSLPTYSVFLLARWPFLAAILFYAHGPRSTRSQVSEWISSSLMSRTSDAGARCLERSSTVLGSSAPSLSSPPFLPAGSIQVSIESIAIAGIRAKAGTVLLSLRARCFSPPLVRPYANRTRLDCSRYLGSLEVLSQDPICFCSDKVLKDRTHKHQTDEVR